MLADGRQIDSRLPHNNVEADAAVAQKIVRRRRYFFAMRPRLAETRKYEKLRNNPTTTLGEVVSDK